MLKCGVLVRARPGMGLANPEILQLQPFYLWGHSTRAQPGRLQRVLGGENVLNRNPFQGMGGRFVTGSV